MKQADLDDLTLEYEDAGTGEPVVCIHGALIADACRPMATEAVLAAASRQHGG